MNIGFLDRQGILHKCETYEHLNFALELIKDMNLTITNALDAEEYLQKMGWVVIRNRDVYSLIGYLDNEGNIITLSEEQKKWLLEEYSHCNTDKQKSIDELFDKVRI